MAKKKQLADPTKLANYQAFYAELQKETERGAAIVGAEFLNQHLAQYITNYLIDDAAATYKLLNPRDPGAPLGTFGARCQLAYCLGLIDAIALLELNTVRSIRNRFAHGLPGTTFATPEVAALVARLKFSERLPEPMPNLDQWSRFVVSVALLLQHISVNTKQVQERRLEPADELVWYLSDKPVKLPKADDLKP